MLLDAAVQVGISCEDTGRSKPTAVSGTASSGCESVRVTSVVMLVEAQMKACCGKITYAQYHMILPQYYKITVILQFYLLSKTTKEI